mgnify:CR=1 FL=1
MAFKRPLPEWNNPGVEPPQSKKDMGWLGREKPPAQWHNWFQHLTYEALKELQASAAHATFGETAPASPDENDLWVDTSGYPVFALKAWDGTQWITVGAVNSVNGKIGDVELTAEDVGAASMTAFNAHLNEITQKFLNVDLNIIDMAVELEILKDATLNGVTANIFVETFQNLDDIKLERGTYNQTKKRLEV